MSKRYLLIFCVACISLGVCARTPQRRSPVTRARDRIIEFMVPLPLRYAAEKEETATSSYMYEVLLRLMHTGDFYVLLSPDGTTTILQYVSPDESVLHPRGGGTPRDLFNELEKTHPRIWVLLYNERAGRHAQPPDAFAPVLRERFFRLPLALPLYVSGITHDDCVTNRWNSEIAILSTLIRYPDVVTPEIYRMLGIRYRLRGNIDRALEIFHNGVSRYPDDPWLHRELGATYYFHVQPRALEESIHHNRRARTLHRRTQGTPFYEAIFNLAMAYADANEIMASRITYQELLDTFVDFPHPYWESQTRRYFSTLLLTHGETNQAIILLELDLDTTAQTPGYSYRKLYDIYIANRQTDNARRLVERYFRQHGHEDPQAAIYYTTFMWDRGAPEDNMRLAQEVYAVIEKHADVAQALHTNREWWQRFRNYLDAARSNDDSTPTQE